MYGRLRCTSKTNVLDASFPSRFHWIVQYFRMKHLLTTDLQCMWIKGLVLQLLHSSNLSHNSSCPRSWAHPRRAGATCLVWCTRNPRGGHTRSRATPASAACGLRWNQPTGSWGRPRIPCSSLSAPSTATGTAEGLSSVGRVGFGWNGFELMNPSFPPGTSLQPTSMRTSAWMRLNGQCTRTGTAGCTASLARTLSWMASFTSELRPRWIPSVIKHTLPRNKV